MGYGLAANKGSVAVEIEDTEGVYKAEQSGESFLEVLSDGLEFSPSKELIERNNRTSTVEQVAARVGQKSMAGSIPVEFRANEVEGAAPEYDALMQSLFGGVRSGTSTVSTTGHTASKIYVADGDISKYSVGDIVKIKLYDVNGSKDHVSPITAVDDSVGTANITLLVAADAIIPDNTEIAAFTTYYHKAGAPTLSVSNYLGGEILEKAIGMRCTEMALNNFSTGALADLAFSLEGLDFDRSVGQPAYTPTFPESLPPVILDSKIYRGGVEVQCNSLSLSAANTVNFLTSTASKSGKIKSRITSFVVNGSLNPYMEDDNIDNFNNFDNNTSFSIFGQSSNYGASDNEKLENVAFYVPNCVTTELTTGTEDGILSDQISFSANRDKGNDTIFMSFI